MFQNFFEKGIILSTVKPRKFYFIDTKIAKVLKISTIKNIFKTFGKFLEIIL